MRVSGDTPGRHVGHAAYACWMVPCHARVATPGRPLSPSRPSNRILRARRGRRGFLLNDVGSLPHNNGAAIMEPYMVSAAAQPHALRGIC